MPMVMLSDEEMDREVTYAKISLRRRLKELKEPKTWDQIMEEEYCTINQIYWVAMSRLLNEGEVQQLDDKYWI